MNQDYSEVQSYATQFTTDEPPVLAALHKATYKHVPMARMISDPSLGRMLAMISKMIQPKVILEIGTFTGYSAICLAEGLHPDGILHTIDKNKKLVPMVQEYLSKAGIYDKVKCHLGNAKDIIPTIKATFDLVFIDADKANYSNYYHLFFPSVRSGGLILADNMLMNGKVLNQRPDEVSTQGIKDFTNLVHNDPSVENVWLPLRDGLMLIRKK